jgi:hypothetical protein
MNDYLIMGKKKDIRINRKFSYSERNNIEFPLWRKKVDRSIFHEKCITIAKFAQKWWELNISFKDNSNSKKDELTKIEILFEKVTYNGNLCFQNTKTRKNTFRLHYPQDLADRLKEVFLMSYMRDKELRLGKYDEDENNRVSIEDVIPFQEFLDIEYSPKNKTFIFTAHYIQKPTFPSLFKEIMNTTVLKSIDSSIDGKEKTSIIKSNWHDRSNLSKIPPQTNVIYTLIDINNKELYIGEAKELISRIGKDRTEIPNYTHFRYDVLPAVLEPYRLELERMIIRSFASLLSNSKIKKETFEISDFTLKNSKIDK